MYFFDLEDYGPRCRTKEDIINDGGRVVENDNGTVTVFIQTTDGLVSQPLTKPCCETLGSVKGEAGIEYLYTFDIDTQECRWSAGCDNSTKPFKVVMNPLGNDGVIFNTNQTNNEKCTLRISFDYLFQIDCDDFMARLREANSTQGQDPRTLELISSLQSQQEKCQRTLESLQTQLVVLSNELEATPFVIQCTTAVIVNVKDPIRYQTTIKPRGNLDVGFGTTRMMYSYDGNTTTYCLTDLGLQSWSNILGNNDYVTWFNSNGTNTTMYTCEDVNNLVAQDNFSGDLLGTCNVSLTARDEIWKEIVNIQKQILELEKNCERITSQLTELLPDVACSTVSEILETLNVAMTLDMVNSSTGALETVYEQTLLNIGLGNLPTYLTSTTPNTGFYSTGTTGNTNCQNVGANLYQELLPSFPNSGTTEIQNLIINSFNSTWLQYETDITDQTLLDMIYNEKIKISFLVKDCCVNFGILVDRIKLTKICENVDNVTFDITKNPSFDMIRVIDNKKSWLANEDFEHREFDLKFRDTQYDINNYKLAINTKEVDLDINPANAIEQDVFCYIRDNECLLECTNMSGDCCCQGEVTTITQDTNKVCTCLYEKIFYDTLDGRYQPLSGYSLTTNWIMSATYNCGELLYETEFFTGNGSSTEELIPTPESYGSALTGMAETLGLDYTYSGGVVTITEVNDCENTYLNNNFKIDLRLTICACYIPYTHDCVTTSGICESLSGDTIAEFIMPDIDFMDDLLYRPSCELFEQYSCGEDAEDWNGQFRVDRDAFVKAQNEYTLCSIPQITISGCGEVLNPIAFDYDFYYNGLAQSATGYTGYSAYHIIGPMRKVNFNWWMPPTYYSAWTQTMTTCVSDPIYSANSLADIFTGITDFNYLPSVADWADISGVTGNIGDIAYVTGTTTQYFWHPIDNQWIDVEGGYDCITYALEGFFSLMRSERNAYIKAKNQLILATKPFLWASVYIPEFQINKYIL